MAAPTTTATDSAAAQAMKTLTAQWYNAVTAGCGLDPQTFQLAQGFMQLGTTSQALWQTFDALPPVSLTHFWNPTQYSSFAATYGGVINNLIPQDSGQFQKTMGDYYPQWVEYLHSTPPPVIPNPGGILELFHQWEQLNMPPGQGQAAYTEYQQVSQGVVPVAVQMWLNAGGGASGIKAYSNTIEDLNYQLSNTPLSKQVTMDSATQSSDVNHSWASGEVGGAVDFFLGHSAGDWDKLTTTIAQAGVEIQAKFNHFATFVTGPLAQPSTNPLLSKYQPWYDSEAISLAYQNNNYYVWNQNAPTWQGTFGPTGNLQYVTTALVVVSGVTVSIESAATFDSSQQESIKASAEVGFFPFFEAESSGGWQHNITFNDEGQLNVASTVPDGVEVVLGVMVTPSSAQFG
ncbi:MULTISPECIES: hypothetical protein [unclassified Saccharothrix]|uniref:hypothetical protein n=1 Tax=unclassified Saccharothrix TaxID=2593673 RepID=UPI00307DBB67